MVLVIVVLVLVLVIIVVVIVVVVVVIVVVVVVVFLIASCTCSFRVSRACAVSRFHRQNRRLRKVNDREMLIIPPPNLGRAFQTLS